MQTYTAASYHTLFTYAYMVVNLAIWMVMLVAIWRIMRANESIANYVHFMLDAMTRANDMNRPPALKP